MEDKLLDIRQFLFRKGLLHNDDLEPTHDEWEKLRKCLLKLFKDIDCPYCLNIKGHCSYCDGCIGQMDSPSNCRGCGHATHYRCSDSVHETCMVCKYNTDGELYG